MTLVLYILGIWLVFQLMDVVIYLLGLHYNSIWLDSHGWPITYIKGRPIANYIRWRLYVNFKQSKINLVGWHRVGPCELRPRQTNKLAAVSVETQQEL